MLFSYKIHKASRSINLSIHKIKKEYIGITAVKAPVDKNGQLVLSQSNCLSTITH